MRHPPGHLRRDLPWIIASVGLAVLFGTTDYVDGFLQLTRGLYALEDFIAGMLFTSAFTTAPAIVILGKIAQTGSALETAVFGALGALAGDLILFHFVRDRFAEDFMELLNQTERRRIKHIFRLRLFRWFTPFVGALIIASPLPDELALMLMGFSRTKSTFVAAFSFIANFVGILGISLAAQALGGS